MITGLTWFFISMLLSYLTDILWFQPWVRKCVAAEKEYNNKLRTGNELTAIYSTLTCAPVPSSLLAPMLIQGTESVMKRAKKR